MQITNNNYSPAYKAKFFHTEDLKKVVEYAHQTNCFDKINKARKRIDNAYLTRRLKFEFGKGAEGYPIVIITRYTPLKGIIPKFMEDYIASEPFVFASKQKINPFKFGLNVILKLSNSAPKSNLYKKIVGGIKTIKQGFSASQQH